MELSRFKILAPEVTSAISHNYDHEPVQISGDYTLSAVLRYLCMRRANKLGEKEMLNSKITVFRSTDEADIKYYVTEDNPIPRVTIAYHARFSDEDMHSITENLCDKGFEVCESASQPICTYLSQKALTGVTKCVVLSNAETKQIVLLVRGYEPTVDLMRHFASVLCKVAPWFCDNPLSDDEQKFFKALSSGDMDTVVSVVDSMYETRDWRKEAIAKTLSQWANHARDSQITSLKSSINSFYTSINNYQASIANYYAQLAEAQQKLEAFENMTDHASEDMIKFFTDNQFISIVPSSSNTALTFEIKTLLEYWDVKEAKRVFDKSGTYISGSNYPTEFKKTLRSIFVDQSAKFITAARFSLTGASCVSPVKNYLTDTCGVLPHPHLYFYGCLGGNSDYLQKFAKTGEWEMAILQATSAVKNLNFGDSTVVQRMMSYVYDRQDEPMIMRDGKTISFKQLQEILKNEEEKQNVETTEN